MGILYKGNNGLGLLFLRELKALLYKEVLIEWRNPAALGGIFLYLLSSVFTVSLFFEKGMHSALWVVLFWVLMVFIGINAIAKSFISESPGQMLYLYQLASATAIIVAKSIYNIILLGFLGILTFAFFSFFLGFPKGDLGLLLGIICLGNAAISVSLTFISAITAMAGAPLGLMAILSLPTLLPQLLLSIRLSIAALNGVLLSKYLAGIILITLILFFLSAILFPYLWRE